MAAIARPPRQVTVTYTTVDDDTPIDPAAPIAKYRLKNGPAAGTDLSLTKTATGVYTAEIPGTPGEHHVEAGSSDPDDLVEPIVETLTIEPSGF